EFVVSSTPSLLPSTLNCTPTTPILSDASAEMEIVPETVDPLVGAVIETMGGAVSDVPPVTSVGEVAMVVELGEEVPGVSEELLVDDAAPAMVTRTSLENPLSFPLES